MINISILRVCTKFCTTRLSLSFSVLESLPCRRSSRSSKPVQISRRLACLFFYFSLFSISLLSFSLSFSLSLDGTLECLTCNAQEVLTTRTQFHPLRLSARIRKQIRQSSPEDPPWRISRSRQSRSAISPSCNIHLIGIEAIRGTG